MIFCNMKCAANDQNCLSFASFGQSKETEGIPAAAGRRPNAPLIAGSATSFHMDFDVQGTVRDGHRTLPLRRDGMDRCGLPEICSSYEVIGFVELRTKSDSLSIRVTLHFWEYLSRYLVVHRPAMPPPRTLTCKADSESFLTSKC